MFSLTARRFIRRTSSAKLQEFVAGRKVADSDIGPNAASGAPIICVSGTSSRRSVFGSGEALTGNRDLRPLFELKFSFAIGVDERPKVPCIALLLGRLYRLDEEFPISQSEEHHGARFVATDQTMFGTNY